MGTRRFIDPLDMPKYLNKRPMFKVKNFDMVIRNKKAELTMTRYINSDEYKQFIKNL